MANCPVSGLHTPISTVKVSEFVDGDERILCHVQFPMVESVKDSAGRMVVRWGVDRMIGCAMVAVGFESSVRFGPGSSRVGLSFDVDLAVHLLHTDDEK